MDANDDIGLFRAIVNKVIESYRRDPRLNRGQSLDLAFRLAELYRS